MNTRTWAGLALVLPLMMLTACTGTPEPATSTALASPAPTPGEERTGTRENPVPFGQSYTFEDIGEAGGPAWTVTIDEPRDMSAEIFAAAVDLYGSEDESYLSPSRPDPGETFLGFTGTVERLMDAPATPGSDLTTALISADGKTFDVLQLGVTPPEEYLTNISEMYKPAQAKFSNVQPVPQGAVAQQVMVTMRNTGERVYFGQPAAQSAASGGTTTTPAAPADPEAAFLELLVTQVPSLAEPVANNPREVFIDWGRYQCDQVREQGAEALWESLRGAFYAGGEAEDKARGFSEEMGVTAVAAATLCPDILAPVQQFATEVEDIFPSTAG